MKIFLVLGWLSFFINSADAGSSGLNPGEDLYNKGFQEALKGNHDKAVHLFLNALSVQPDWPEAHHQLAIQYYKLKDGVHAIHHLIQAEKLYLKSKNPRSQTNLAIVRKNLKKAFDHFDLKPEDFKGLELSISSELKKDWEPTGTGFLFGNQGYILTLYHFIPPDGNIRIRYQNQKTAAVTLERKFIIYNLALLRLKDATSASQSNLQIGDSSQLNEGDNVMVLDFKNTEINQMNCQPLEGKLLALEAIQHDTNIFEINLPIKKNHLGAPLLNSSGQVVGINLSKPHAMKAFQAAGRMPEGEISIKSSYLAKILSGFSDLAITNSTPKKSSNHSVKFSSKLCEDTGRSIVTIEAKK